MPTSLCRTPATAAPSRARAPRRPRAFLATTALLFTCASAHATIFVRGDGSDSQSGSSWTAAKATVQAGVNAAARGEEVWVAEGTYVEAVTLPAGALLYGGFAGTETERGQRDWTAHPTIVDADHKGTTVLINGSKETLTVVDGFTLRNAASFSSTDERPGSVGAGVACLGGVATIANNTIVDNRGSQGGGILCENAIVAILGNTIARNNGAPGGGIYGANSTLTISRNVIRDNVGNVMDIYGPNNGNGVYGNGGAITLEHNIITRNGGPALPGDPGGGNGVWITGGITLSARGNVIAQNFGDGLVASSGAASLTGNVLAGNGSAGARFANATATLTNNTVTGNNSGLHFGLLEATIVNTLVAFNGGDGIAQNPASPSATNLTFSHNNVYGNADQNYDGPADPTGTDGNISADPKLSSIFTRPHLQPGSPCIDAGDDSVVEAGETDMDGQPRIQGAHVDIGADESDGTAWPAGGRVLHVSPTGDDNANGLTWASANKTVGAALSAAEGDDEIWVAAGTYVENVIVPAGIAVYGGFTGSETEREQRNWAVHKTVLDGAGHQTVVRTRGQRIRVDGFTIRNGRTIDAGAGGGVAGNGSLTLANNVITQNRTDTPARGGGDGGGVAAFGTLTLLNNVVSNNEGYHGGGVAVYGDATITGNTIVNNGSSREGGGVYVPGVLTMTNTIVAFNTAGSGLSGVHMGAGSSLSHNDLFGNGGSVGASPDPTGTNGNVSVDPQFVDNASDLRLAAGSPLIDAGDDSAVQPGERDRDGRARIQGLHVDIGAYEFPAPTPVFTMKDVADSLKIAGGLLAGSEETARLNIVDAAASGIDVRDAAALARNAAGLDPNP